MPLNFSGILISYLEPLPSAPVHFWNATNLAPSIKPVSEQPSAALAELGTATANVATSAAEIRAIKPFFSFRFFMSLLVSHS